MLLSSGMMITLSNKVVLIVYDFIIFDYFYSAIRFTIYIII